MASEFCSETMGDSEGLANAFEAVRVGAVRASKCVPKLEAGAGGSREESTAKEPEALTKDEGTRISQKKKRKNHRGGQKKKNKGEKLSLADEQDNAATKDRDETDMEIAGVVQLQQSNPPSGKLYEIRPSVGKGLGVFADQDIKCGTRIMCEQPMMSIPSTNVLDVPAAFLKLSEDDQATFRTLQCRPLGVKDAEITDLLRIHPFQRLKAAALSVQEQVEVMAIFETNNFGIERGSAIFPEASRINHSCVPNVFHGWNITLGAETIHAVRDISQGEELVTTYGKICRDHASRQLDLSRTYGFRCNCTACDVSTTFGRASEKRRKHLFQLDQDLARYSHLPSLSSFQNNRQALCAVEESLKLLREEGIDNIELGRNYKEAASLCARLDDINAARQWAQKALKNAAICRGTEDEDYKEVEKALQNKTSQKKALQDLVHN